jgi:hypothetical protein
VTEYGEMLREALRETIPLYPRLPGLVYHSPFEFVFKHGREYERSKFEGVQGVPKMCFGNAIVDAAKHGFRYVEGFALTPEGEVIMHGWCVRPDGRLHDSTWCNTGLAYIGVEFSVERGDDATWNGDGCVLNDENRGYPIFRQPWTGEDYTLTWPPSDRLEMLRRSEDTRTPASVAEFLNRLREQMKP